MTDRLRDLASADDPAVAELARLVRAVGELDPPPGAQDRVREALEELPRRRPWPQLLVVAIVVLVLTVVTPAVIAGVWKLVVRVPAPPVSVEDRAVSAAPPAPVRGPSRVAIASPAAPRMPDPALARAPEAQLQLDVARTIASAHPTVEPPQVAGSSEQARVAAPSDATGSAALRRSEADAGPPQARTQAEGALVLRALHLLRYDHDARGALRALDEHRARFPTGDLAEEALALSIEAHLALRDDTARGLADQYLATFPGGRFRDVAEQARRTAR